MKMKTPIYNFVKKYSDSDISRFHMPGHKGVEYLGCESMDITEIYGADSLYEADGIIRESEKNASKIFDTGDTFYSTEGSSLCIRTMIYTALINTSKKPLIAAARNVHKSFVYTVAALDLDVCWIYPKNSNSLCSGSITADEAERVLKEYEPFALYITSPNYIGEMSDIKEIARICKKYDTPLLVDNAHGAYLKFFDMHPINLGAAMCCDSAHKTLPVLTGGAYLHISKEYNKIYSPCIKDAMSFFASTSPSYLTLCSLDLCNKTLASNYDELIQSTFHSVNELKEYIKSKNFELYGCEPLKITIHTNGNKMAERLREHGGECEYSDDEFIVFMFTPQNTKKDFELIKKLISSCKNYEPITSPIIEKGEKAISIRKALLSKQELVKTEHSVGRICASPTVSCPPAVPIAVSGELITEKKAELFKFYGIDKISCVKTDKN